MLDLARAEEIRVLRAKRGSLYVAFRHLYKDPHNVAFLAFGTPKPHSLNPAESIGCLDFVRDGGSNMESLGQYWNAHQFLQYVRMQ